MTPRELAIRHDLSVLHAAELHGYIWGLRDQDEWKPEYMSVIYERDDARDVLARMKETEMPKRNPQNLPEAPDKWLCDECGHIMTSDTLLTAPNPFDPEDRISGCERCKSAECITAACMFEDCSMPVSGGYPGGYGYRHFNSCWKHSPTNPENFKGDET